MSDRVTTAARVALTLTSFTSFGCAESDHDLRAPEISGSGAELIGGVPANSPRLDAIGSIGVTESYLDCFTGERVTYNRIVCTASLISERVVLTAKHCLDGLRQTSGGSPFFAIGPNALAPQRVVPIVDMQGSPVEVGGFNESGRDVAVLYLGSPVTDLTPLRIAQLDSSAIGSRFGAIGYGAQDNASTAGTRMAGSVTINALEGRVYELIFGSYELFRDWYLSTNGTPRPGLPRALAESPSSLDAGVAPMPVVDASIPPPEPDAGLEDSGVPDWVDAYLRRMYENTQLLPGYEAYVGNRPGDAQLCYGDSGGPLTRAQDGQLYAYGVVSGGIHSRTLICDYGAVYASFGPETITFLQRAQAWVDPCDGVTAQGSCDGDVASRCTTPGEGNRRLTVTDCSLLGQTCAIGTDGRAACATPGEPPVIIDEGSDECEWFPGQPSGDGGVNDDDDDSEPAPDPR